ncbi:alpha-2-HS-glycoprotein 1 [Triplophysa rosa]|uniref:Fetuin long form n=1 Tax=Triplophysa rosa TaxID=992332 RepID=A0A9W7T3F9_TRIRA|nr:alpha-2-HS-glycoprotein 1 [Triplophysa rosa]KAI7789581.1 fetuin long form [Triplophysa rosa]
MRELVIVAALISALYAISLPPASEVEYKCQEDQDNNATRVAEQFINNHHRHGYKFKFVSLDSRTAEGKADACEVVLKMTLKETECHIVNPKPLDQCNIRSESETSVTAKCNVTIYSMEGKAAVKCYICGTEPASHELLVRQCPDCSALLPLHDPQGLETVKTALQKFNKESNQTSYFKLVEVGRISTQWMFSGQGFFAEFAIVETDCPNKQASPEACKALCVDQARYGFCKSSKVQDLEPTVECEVFEAHNSTQHMYHHGHSRRDCKSHRPPPHHHHCPEHTGHGHKDKTPDHSGRPEHTGHGHKDKSPDHRGRPEHAGHGHKEKTPDHRGRPEHSHHADKDIPHCPKGPSAVPVSRSEGHHEFPCHGFVKIPPSIYPICPFPPPRPCRGPPDFAPPPAQ